MNAGPEEEAISFLKKMHDRWRPRRTAVLFSGGRDSLVAAHLAHRAYEPENFDVVFIDTTIGLPETRDYVSRVCDAFGWKLVVVRGRNTFEELAVRWGFPTPQYRWCTRALKIDALRSYQREHGRVMWISGMRRDESQRRVKLARLGKLRRVYRDGLGVFVSPIFDWNDEEIGSYIDRHGLPTNEVVWNALGFSGDCFCGVFKSPGEVLRLRGNFPHMFWRLVEIEQRVNLNRRRERPIYYGKKSLEELARQTSLVEWGAGEG